MVEVRALSADEWRVTKQLRLAALLDAPDAFGGTYEQTARRTEAEWRSWPAGGQPFAAFQDGKPVGLTCAVASDDPSTTHLVSMWVSPEARGQGAGERLIAAVAGWARARGCKTLALDVYTHNKPAYRVYERAGFEPVGPDPDHPGAILMRLSV